MLDDKKLCPKCGRKACSGYYKKSFFGKKEWFKWRCLECLHSWVGPLPTEPNPVEKQRDEFRHVIADVYELFLEEKNGCPDEKLWRRINDVIKQPLAK